MRATPQPASRQDSPLVSVRGVVLALVAATLLCWPMLIVSAPLMFPDSVGYVNTGGKILNTLVGLVSPGAPAESGAGSAAETAAGTLAAAVSKVEMLRSAPYSIYAFLTSLSPVGLAGSVIVQTAAVLFMLGALIKREVDAPPTDIVLAALACGTLTSLPWFASYLMPDILAAAVVLFAAVLVRGYDTLHQGQRLALCGITAFAIVSHYGHIPLAVACVGAALGLRALQRRLTRGALIAGVAPIAIAVVANVALGTLVLDGPSVAPRRLPVLLARSIGDGPARWHLEEHCETEHYTICDLFDEIPETAGDVLWSETGLRRSATTDQMVRIRAEEPVILWRAFLEYPAQQSWSLVGNTAKQLVSLGTDDFQWAAVKRATIGELKSSFDRDRGRALIEAFGVTHAASVAFAILALALMARSDGLRVGEREREVLLVVAFGLLANAAIFGALSAPTDRYQSRVVWILPALVALFWLERRRRCATRAR